MLKGRWEGAVSLPGMELAIAVTLDSKDDGQWTGKIDSPAQGVKDLALGTIFVEGQSVSFAITGVPGDPTFKGDLSADGATISGDFTQGGQTFPFGLAKKSETKSEPPRGALEPTEPIAQTVSIEGTWLGVLDIGGTVRVILKVLKAPDGTLQATLDSPDQGAMNLPVDTIDAANETMRFEMTALNAFFEGTLSEDGQESSGKWTQGGASLALVLKRTDEEVKLNRPQEPKKPYPYNEEDVAYENPRAGIELAGTLTLPRSKGPFPVVLLLTGSGAHERDETIFGHKPFLVLSDYLTRQGLAVMRMDDRGIGGSTGNVSDSTTEDFADDALAGVEYLKGRKDIDAKRIGLVGHSEGGSVAAMAASKSDDIAFIVMMAGPGLPGEDILYLQGAAIAKVGGAGDQEIAKQRAAQERVFSVLKTENDEAVAEERLRELGDELVAGMTEEQRKAGGAQAVEAQHKAALTPWFRFFLTYDPRPALTKVRCPVLALIGEHDVQVPHKENLTAIDAALKAGGNKDYATLKLPKLNHLFQTSQTGSLAEYAKIEETISPAAMRIVSDWILKRTH